MWVSEEALAWSIEQLREWSSKKRPGKRFKQNLYRFFLLRQLGVTENCSKTLALTDFSKHCQEYLLVSGEGGEALTGGRRSYFVPFTCEYQYADSQSDWAVGTLWTRLDTAGRLYLDISAGEGQRKNIRFKENFESYFIGPLSDNPIPLLALSIFLLRSRDISLADGEEEKAGVVCERIIDKFLTEFNLAELGWIDSIFERNGGDVWGW